MNRFEYADNKFSEIEMMIAIPSFIIGVGILSLPQALASATTAMDGVFSILIAGGIVTFITWAIAKFAASFPDTTFISYASLIVSKPVAILLTFLFAIVFFSITAYQVRKIADISKQYLFDQTPVEVISLTFFLVIIYAVSGSRVGIIRLNMMFFPFILFIAIIVVIFNLNWFKFSNFLPVFQSNINDYLTGVNKSLFSFGGFGILWFYMAYVNKPNKAPKMAALGTGFPIALYALIFLACIGVYGESVTASMLYPTVELAKMVEIPGGILERFESIFFVIWIMAIFNTTAMAFDITVLAINLVFHHIPKIKIIFLLSPLIYAIAMYPQNLIEVSAFETFLNYAVFYYSIFVLVLLFVVAKIRGVKPSE
ncbi:endospore germination permease [Gracilibacillus sp. YIM 98692]|uniref:GerAB/ArcD/ProY family transporter n=1 Tax=Gracilibacillus sp. YIM 98692 TaxID=2663532 RepID=UPI0013D42C6A|nr:endospore germination permease [Gracilibacillus sp. YIM 98692]